MRAKDRKALDKIRRNLNLAWGAAYDLNAQKPCGSLMSKIEEAQTTLNTVEDNLSESFVVFPQHREH